MVANFAVKNVEKGTSTAAVSPSICQYTYTLVRIPLQPEFECPLDAPHLTTC